MNYITTEWSMLWIVGCIALSIAVSYVLYNKGVFRCTLWLRRFLFALRFATFFILTFLLLKPYINHAFNTFRSDKNSCVLDLATKQKRTT